MIVYYQQISQVEDKGSGDGICKGEDKDDGGKDEEDDEGEDQAKDQPHVDQLYVGGGGDLVGDGLVESVNDQHHGDADGGRGLEVLGPEVKPTLADEHKAQGG